MTSMTPVTDSHKEVARHVAAAFSADEPPIHRVWDDDHKSDVFVLQATDRPWPVCTACSTGGLFAHPLIMKGKELPLRAEIAGICRTGQPDFDKVLSTLAFCVINTRWCCAPGVIFPGVIDMYGLSNTLSDVFSPPTRVCGPGNPRCATV
jgi:antitoxin YqcF